MGIHIKSKLFLPAKQTELSIWFRTENHQMVVYINSENVIYIHKVWIDKWKSWMRKKGSFQACWTVKRLKPEAFDNVMHLYSVEIFTRKKSTNTKRHYAKDSCKIKCKMLTTSKCHSNIMILMTKVSIAMRVINCFMQRIKCIHRTLFMDRRICNIWGFLCISEKNSSQTKVEAEKIWK